MDISLIKAKAFEFETQLSKRKQDLGDADFGWYPYGTLSNFGHLDNLLTGERRRLLDLIGEEPCVDIGAADGDTAFFMESLGKSADVVDYAPTNFNSCRGVKALRDATGSAVRIFETDLDREFRLPAERYGFAFFLGILYHLKNPFLALEGLARHARHAVISTRVTRFNRAEGATSARGQVNDTRIDMGRVPAAYLVDPLECNNDPTNFWIFTVPGLKRILQRSGWEVLDFMTVGAVDRSDPASAEGDERAFCLVRSLGIAASGP